MLRCRIAIAPCIIGPETRPGDLEAACAAIGADSAAPLGAHDSVAKLVMLAYGQVLEQLERHFRHLPVVDKNGKLLGMLSIRNLLEWRIDALTQELDSLEQYVSNDGPGG